MNKQEIQNKLNENLKLIEKGGNEIDKLKQENKKLIEEFIKLDNENENMDYIKYPKEGSEGYVVMYGKVHNVTYQEEDWKDSFIAGEWFETREDAEIELMYRKLYFKLKNYAKRKGYLVDRKDVANCDIEKNIVYLDFSDNELVGYSFNFTQDGSEFKDLYFKSFEGMIETFNKFKSEVLEYLNKKYWEEFKYDSYFNINN